MATFNTFHGCIFTILLTLAVSNVVIIPVLLQMGLYTFPIIYIGSHLSLRQAEVDEETGERPMKADSINKREAMLFPVLGSCALFSLYIAYKLMEPYIVNLLLTFYLTVVGSVALAETLSLFLEPLAPNALLQPDRVSGNLTLWPLGSVAEPWHFSCSWLQLVGYVSALFLSIMWMWTKNWVLHNLFAISFCIQAIALVSVGSFTVASILLSGLFFYDIFWVFGTEVMVTVARMFEAPAKIIFPVSFDPWQQSILGLGDVVIPGIFISMCLRFDNWLHEKRVMDEAEKKMAIGGDGVEMVKRDAKKSGGARAGREEKKEKGDDDDDSTDKAAAASVDNGSNGNKGGGVDIHESFRKFYFWVVVISYELGLMTTGAVMYIFRHPQPALLYLVPYCLLSLFGAAAMKGQVNDVFAYREDEDEGPAAAVENGDDEPGEERDDSEEEEGEGKEGTSAQAEQGDLKVRARKTKPFTEDTAE